MTLMRIRLTDADRKRLGVDEEWLPVDPDVVSGREAAALQKPWFEGSDGRLRGYDTPRHWRFALVGEPVIGTDGKPVTRLIDGEEITVRRPVYEAGIALTWLALKHAGIDTSLRDLDVDVDGQDWEEDKPEGPGKDESTESDPTTTLS